MYAEEKKIHLTVSNELRWGVVVDSEKRKKEERRD